MAYSTLFIVSNFGYGKGDGMKGDIWMEIRNDRLKGMNYTELGKKYHIDPRTAKRYAESPQRPEYTLSERKPSKLDTFKSQTDLWLEEAPYSAVRIREKLQEQGFDGKYSIVKEYVRGKKMDLDESTATVRFETMPGQQGQMDWGVFEDHTVLEDGLYFFTLLTLKELRAGCDKRIYKTHAVLAGMYKNELG